MKKPKICVKCKRNEDPAFPLLKHKPVSWNYEEKYLCTFCYDALMEIAEKASNAVIEAYFL
jgi:hypothetical protein